MLEQARMRQMHAEQSDRRETSHWEEETDLVPLSHQPQCEASQLAASGCQVAHHRVTRHVHRRDAAVAADLHHDLQHE